MLWEICIQVENFEGSFVCESKNATRIIYCFTRLHNFCANEGDAVPEMNPEDPKELPPEYWTARAITYKRTCS